MKNYENNFNAWASMMNHMANSWKNVAGEWSTEQKGSMEDINTLIRKWMENYRQSIQGMGDPFKQAQSSGMGMFDFFNLADSMSYKQFMLYNSLSSSFYKATQTLMQPVTDMLNQMSRYTNQSFGPFFPMNRMPDANSFLELMDNWNLFTKKAMEFQSLHKNVASSAWEKMMNSINERINNGKPFADFAEFYNEWSAVNEEALSNLTKSEEYIKLQQELVKLREKITKPYEQAFHNSSFPFAFKSDLEEIARTDNDLRERVEKLEKKLVKQ